MDIIKYRKMYLSGNGGNSRFIMIKHKVDYHGRTSHFAHPLVVSGGAFWVNDTELCLGYELNTNSTIFRPIFSHKRQCLLDELHSNIVNPTTFWNRVKRRYYFTISRVKKLPLECVIGIVTFIY